MVHSVEYVGNDSEGSVSFVDERVVVKTMNKTDNSYGVRLLLKAKFSVCPTM